MRASVPDLRATGGGKHMTIRNDDIGALVDEVGQAVSFCQAGLASDDFVHQASRDARETATVSSTGRSRA
jgi:hypothetical protein